MKQNIRRITQLIMLVTFPATLNYFSPAVPIMGAFQGIVAGSLITFALLFISGVFFRRAWCGWLCPGGAIGDLCMQSQGKRANVGILNIIRYSVFTIWLGVIVLGFSNAGGIKLVQPLFLTENVVSVDAPEKYIIYFIVVGTFMIMALLLGRRAACHGICWMSPFLEAGAKTGEWLGIPQLSIKAQSEHCISCQKCTKVCPMSIDVMARVATDSLINNPCINCGQCIESCPKKVLSF